MTLFFMHITKTAGGSLKEALRLSDADVLFHYRTEPGFDPKFRYEASPDIVFGHYIFGAHAKMQKGPRYGCFVREPVARSVSHYHHLRNNDQGKIGNLAREHGDIEDFLRHSRHWEFDNFLCRIISGVGNKAQFGDIGFKTYEKALSNINEFFEYIGVFEDLENSLHRLRDIIPDLDMQLPTINKGKYDPGLTKSACQVIRALNAFDTLLYQEISELHL